MKNEFIIPQREPETRVMQDGVLKLMAILNNELLGTISFVKKPRQARSQ